MKSQAFTFHPHHQIDQARWDTCVGQSPQFLVYGLSWYLNLVSPGWGALIAGAGGAYEAVMPLPLVQKWGFHYLSQPLFAQQLGVFGAPGLSARDWAALLAGLPRQVRLAAHYQFNAHNTPALAAVLASHPVIGSQLAHTHHLDLSPSYAHLRAGYHRDRQQNLQRAERGGLALVESTDLEPLLAMFAQSVAPKLAGGVHPQAYTRLRAVYAALRARGLARLWYAALPSGELGAGTLFAQSGQRVIYLFNAAPSHARKAEGRTWLLDQFFRQHAGQPLVFDFESAQVPDIAYFYHSFGAQAVPFCRIWYNQLPWWARAAWWAKKRLTK